MKSIDPLINSRIMDTDVISFHLKLKEGDQIKSIASSLDRYGEFIVLAEDRSILDRRMSFLSKVMNQWIVVQ